MRTQYKPCYVECKNTRISSGTIPDQSFHNMKVHFIGNRTVANEQLLCKRKTLVLLLLGMHIHRFI